MAKKQYDTVYVLLESGDIITLDSFESLPEQALCWRKKSDKTNNWYYPATGMIDSINKEAITDVKWYL